MYKPMDDDTSIASRCPRPPHGPFGSPLARSSSSHTRARERTRRANERPKKRTRIFFSRRYRHDAHRYASRARLDRECARAHSRGNAIRIFGNARERDAGDAGDAETREGAREMFWIFFGFACARVGVARSSRGRRRSRARGRRRSRARGRRRAVDRARTARRPDETSRVSI